MNASLVCIFCRKYKAAGFCISISFKDYPDDDYFMAEINLFQFSFLGSMTSGSFWRHFNPDCDRQKENREQGSEENNSNLGRAIQLLDC